MTPGEYVVSLVAQATGLPQYRPSPSIRSTEAHPTSPRITKGRDSILAKPHVEFGRILKDGAGDAGLKYGAYLVLLVERALTEADKSDHAQDMTHSQLTDDDDEQRPDTPAVASRELGAHEMATAFVKRPGLYLGFPSTHDRAIAFAQGFDMALMMAGDPSSHLREYREQLQLSSDHERATTAQQLERIQALLPAFEELFVAAAEIARTRNNE